MEEKSAPILHRSLPLEMFHGEEISRKHEFRKEELRKEGANNTYKSSLNDIILG